MKNKVVFISGASRGIGQSLANYFAEKDYYVVGTSRNDFNLKIHLKILFQSNLISHAEKVLKIALNF